MDGLGITETRFAEVAKHRYMRMEPDFYLASSGTHANFVLGEDAFKFVQYGTSKALNEDGNGFPVLRLNEFDNDFIGEPSKFCDLIDDRNYEELRLRTGDVLVCRTNGNPKLVGKSAYVPKDYSYAFASYLFRVRPRREVISSQCLMVYLNSKCGRREIERYSMVSNQANFSPAKLNEIQIPIFGDDLQIKINELVGKAHTDLEVSKDLYRLAETHLLDELQLSKWQPPTENKAIASKSEVFLDAKRFDAEFFQPKYKEYKNILERYACGATLGQIAKLRKGFQARELSDDGVLYASIKDVSGFLVESIERTNEGELVLIEPDEVVLAITGATIGKCGINATDEQIAISGDLVGIKPTNVSPYYLQIVLASRPIQDLCRQYTTGATNGHLAVSDAATFPFPMIDLTQQNKIAEKVREAIICRQESKRLLEIAKRAVEIAIEQNEDAAMEFIRRNS